MGELFSKMSSLVLEQGELVARIEDDVEAGLLNTEEVSVYPLCVCYGLFM